MPVKTLNEDGDEVEYYTADELAAERSARETAEARIGELTNDLVSIKRGHKEEVRRLAEMSEEEKGKLTNEQIQNMARIEQLEDNRKKDLESAKERMMSAIAKNDQKVLEKIKEKYALVQMPESTVEEIASRLNSVATWAYSELGMTVNNPIAPVLPGGGNPPIITNVDDKPFSDTEKGKEVASALFGDALKNNQ